SACARRILGVDHFRDWSEKANPRQVRTDANGHYEADDVARGSQATKPHATSPSRSASYPFAALSAARIENARESR
ncbi:MAG: hypothetical protein SGI86_19900, partial [Deltaproteobacteria bacterium]|nr:hypothetical protein [Deltaproteobacteria bacterium]